MAAVWVDQTSRARGHEHSCRAVDVVLKPPFEKGIGVDDALGGLSYMSLSHFC